MAEYRRLIARQFRKWAHKICPGGRMSKTKEEYYRSLFSKMEKLVLERQLYTDSTLSMEVMAAQVGTNRTYLARALKICDKTFTGYINGFRIMHATRLMGTCPKMRLSEVAERSGFSSRRSLNYFIVKKYGITLPAFKQRISQLLSELQEVQIQQPCRKAG